MDDRDLLSRYARDRDESAFTELVQTHLNFVYAAALRQVGGDAHLAEDVVQEVFADLARKAATLEDHPVLKGWLFTSARFAAAKTVRRERLRTARERSADVMQDKEDAIRWDEIRPALDEVLAGLKPAERDAVLLRFFEGKGYAEIGERLRIGEDAARMRVDRALDRMRDRLARRGIASTAAALGTVLTLQAAVVAPAGMGGSVARAALVHAGGMPAAGVLQAFMGTKTTLGAVALLGVAGLISIPTVGVAIHETRAARQARAEILGARVAQRAQVEELQQLKQEAGRDAARVAEIQALLSQAQATKPGAAASGAGGSAASYASTSGRGDGAAFLAAYPQIRPLLLESGKLRTDPKLLAILAKAGMSAEQIDALNTRMWSERIDSLKATPDLGLGWTVSGLPSPDELRPIIGDAGIKAITEWTKMAQVNDAAEVVAAQVGLAGQPLTAAQVEELTHAMYTVKPSAALAPGSPDWNAAFGKLQSQLTPEQWQSVENGVAQVGFPRLLNFLEQQAAKSGPVATDQKGATP
ncbi:MAG TPA: sigma-70 family RNA polymerase sigma factor [Opitutaceae bacterium]|nr:sigma-70 family RNA polymerase sigma factor [Opitutaceae bacterium]